MLWLDPSILEQITDVVTWKIIGAFSIDAATLEGQICTWRLLWHWPKFSGGLTLLHVMARQPVDSCGSQKWSGAWSSVSARCLMGCS